MNERRGRGAGRTEMSVLHVHSITRVLVSPVRTSMAVMSGMRLACDTKQEEEALGEAHTTRRGGKAA